MRNECSMQLLCCMSPCSCCVVCHHAAVVLYVTMQLLCCMSPCSCCAVCHHAAVVLYVTTQLLCCMSPCSCCVVCHHPEMNWKLPNTWMPYLFSRYGREHRYCILEITCWRWVSPSFRESHQISKNLHFFRW